MSSLCKCLIALFAIMVIWHHCTCSATRHQGYHHNRQQPGPKFVAKESMTQQQPPTYESNSVGADKSNDLSSFYTNPSDHINVADPMKLASATATNNMGQHDAEVNDFYSNRLQSDMSQTDFDVNDFLPQDINNSWFQTDVNNAKNNVDQAALIDVAKFCQGVDTIGQTLKNPSYDIRGNIPNPKIVVSPFLNSSYDPDTNIKSWC